MAFMLADLQFMNVLLVIYEVVVLPTVLRNTKAPLLVLYWPPSDIYTPSKMIEPIFLPFVVLVL